MPIYTETQRLRQPIAILPIALAALICWGIFGQQIVRGKPVGDDPMPDWAAWLLTALIGVGLPLFFLWFRMETTVSSDRIEIRMAPFSHRVIRPSEIAGASARTYRPLREYGGWGIRGFSSNRAYNINGNQGVQLVLTDGKRVLIGTQKPDELEAAITSILPSR
ncbi:MAG: hypothetical protein KC438_07870 [Thermomicrobiales bacterium]|nr:hypothetical protein [Thermomicrobiales bacterium]